jgi:hypothetical protein
VTDRAGLTVSDDIRQAALAITDQPGFGMETDTTFSGQAYVRLIAPPAGRGQSRSKYLVVAPTISDCFYVLSEVTDGR